MTKSPKYTLSTITLSGKYTDCEFNLFNVGKYLNIDDDIIGIKYYSGHLLVLKGLYLTNNLKKTKKKIKTVNQNLFYNQISIIINNTNDNKHINLKLFKNGSIQITGCKNIKNIDYYINLLYNKLNVLKDKTQKIILTKDKNNILLDCNNFIYVSDTTKIYQVVGFYDEDKKYILYNNEKFINKQNIKKYISNDKDDLIIIDYNINPFVKHNTVCSYQINIDCININFNTNHTLNRNKFYEYLINNMYICKYNPEIYSGIKLIFKDNTNSSHEKTGLCQCNNKCICTNITFLIFQTGNVIGTGFKSFEQIDVVHSKYLSILNEFNHMII